MKIITVETLKKFLDELNKKYGTEFYTKAEIDEKLKSNGGSVDFKELAERIPSWQWKVTMPKTINQTVTATVGEQTYTSDFYAPQGSNITFSAKADDGYKAGTLSLESVTLTEDTAVTITEAKEKKLVAGKFEAYFDPASGSMPEPLTVPYGVNVVKIYLRASNPVYAKVVEGMVLEFSQGTVTRRRITHDVYKATPRGGDSYVYYVRRDVSEKVWLYLEWSQEINEQTANVDLTQAGQTGAVKW